VVCGNNWNPKECGKIFYTSQDEPLLGVPYVSVRHMCVESLRIVTTNSGSLVYNRVNSPPHRIKTTPNSDILFAG
jgi:hypothetical protein